VGLWAATITVLSSMTPPQLEELAPFQFWDKAEHFLAFVAGAVNLTLALSWSTAWSWKRIIIFTAIALAVFGAADEIHQLYTPNRSGADPYDWTADTLGAVTGTLLTSLIYARHCRTRRPAPAGA
jgi:VanZ family protein